jgi:phage terminase large subunit|tara:strand:- start:194 stop:604 length:411 start_codon:yes stop_codon:yes gene_type:complete
MRVFLILFFCIYSNFLFAEILVFKNCKSKNYEFEKNEYRLDIDQGLMTREFIYTDETYERLRFDDIRVKKENETTRVIIRENGLIISEISGYPAFYTQMIFDTFDKTIKLKSVLNNSEGISIISNCEKIIKYKIES